MRGYVEVPDHDWFAFLSQQPEIDAAPAFVNYPFTVEARKSGQQLRRDTRLRQQPLLGLRRGKSRRAKGVRRGVGVGAGVEHVLTSFRH